MNCRVCSSAIPTFALSLPAPGLSSLTTPLDAPTKVAICEACGHAQSPDPVELKAFYDKEYRISLHTESFDQLHSVENGEPVFRTQQQLNVLLGLINVRDNMKVLDFGAAKAQSLKQLYDARPNIIPHAFDVSEDYRQYWAEWIPAERTATYDIPENWNGYFDLVTSYFVLEHIEKPTEFLARMSRLLTADGKLFVIVPDSLSNTGDVLVIDHINHFSRASLTEACALAGLSIEAFDDSGFMGGLAFSARRSPAPSRPDAKEVTQTATRFKTICAEWSEMRASLSRMMDERPNRPLAVHGAGFYGSFVMQQLANRRKVDVILDANPHLQGGEFFGRPVIAPHALPDGIDTVIVALNPSIARTIVGNGSIYGRTNVDTIFLEAS